MTLILDSKLPFRRLGSPPGSAFKNLPLAFDFKVTWIPSKLPRGKGTSWSGGGILMFFLEEGGRTAD